MVKIPWVEFAHGLFIPTLRADATFWTTIVAVFGTTISPYLFFWQASQEVEDNARRPEAAKLRHNPEYAAEHLSRIKQDTSFGMI